MKEEDVLIIRRLRQWVNPERLNPNNHNAKPICLNELTDEQLLQVWSYLTKKHPFTRISRIIQENWHRCLDVKPRSVEMALRGLWGDLGGEPRQQPRGPIQEDAKERRAKSPYRRDNKPPITGHVRQTDPKEHNPLAGMLELIEIQHERINEFRIKEQVDGLPFPELNKMIEACRQLEQDFFKTAVETGLIKTKEKSGPERALDGVHRFLQENISDSSTVAQLMVNFSLNIAQLAMPAKTEPINVTTTAGKPAKISSALPEGALVDGEILSAATAQPA